MKSLKESKQLKNICDSQWQPIIKFLEKPNKDKEYISNWRPISLPNFDLKIISKSLATRVKNVLSYPIDPKQTAYVYERFISETGRLIDDVVKVCDMQKISGYVLTVEKTFDSLNHKVLIAVLKKIRIWWGFYWLDQNFINKPRILNTSHKFWDQSPSSYYQCCLQVH